jgi:UDP-N-acetyl-2-amino-2-deoxyglucuronate dehydrogenase
MKKFALLGAAGYVAPRHMAAIQAVGGNLIAALDPSDSVGILDRYFPQADFFVSFEQFERFAFKQKTVGTPIDYVSICSPNFLHDTHCRFAFQIGADAICEKPLVLSPHNLDRLEVAEEESGRRVNCILQLRLHPEILRLKQQISSAKDKFFNMKLSYITSRGKWYDISWKGNVEKSGGVLFNIGIHFFDMLIFLFGQPQESRLLQYTNDTGSGILEFSNARVEWFLSTNHIYLPQGHPSSTYRSIIIDDEEFEFSSGFNDLHAESYHAILSGRGFGISDVRPSIELVHALRKERNFISK